MGDGVVGGGEDGFGPSTQVSAQPSKQQRPLLGQSEQFLYLYYSRVTWY